MIWKGKQVLFRLSPEGQNALQEVFPAQAAFRAQVVEEDQLGVWILAEAPVF